jgi:ribonucleoside-diphosphate reductase alpha chain
LTVADLSPDDHIAMQAAAEWIDSGISKTVNCPEDIPFEAFKDIYRAAYDAGCGLHDLSARSPDQVFVAVTSVPLATRNADAGLAGDTSPPQGAVVDQPS